jgi:hypothetical protein
MPSSTKQRRSVSEYIRRGVNKRYGEAFKEGYQLVIVQMIGNGLERHPSSTQAPL